MYTRGAVRLKYAFLMPNIFFSKGGYPSHLRPFSGPVLCVDSQTIHSDQGHQGRIMKMVPKMFGTKVTFSLLEVIQQPIQQVLDLQVNLRLLKMNCTVLTPEPSLKHDQRLNYSQVRISLLEVVLGLLQPVQSVLDLQVNLRPLKLISNDCPYPKTLVWTPEPSL